MTAENIFRFEPVVQRTDTWLEWRSKGVTATETAAIQGYEISDHFESAEFMTPWKVWARKNGLIDGPDLSNNPAVQYGIRHEEDARNWFENHTGESAFPACVSSIVYPGLRASLDGLTENEIPVEFKCPTAERFDEMLNLKERSPLFEYYWHQLQAQMAIVGAPRGILVFWRHDRTPVLFTVARNDSYVDRMTAAVKEFHTVNLIGGAEPAKDPDRDYFIPEGETAKRWETYAKEYAQLDEMCRAAKERISELREWFLLRTGNHYAGEYAGLRCRVTSRSGSLDAERLCAEEGIKPDVVEKYRKVTKPSVRITYKNKQAARASLAG